MDPFHNPLESSSVREEDLPGHFSHDNNQVSAAAADMNPNSDSSEMNMLWSNYEIEPLGSLDLLTEGEELQALSFLDQPQQQHQQQELPTEQQEPELLQIKLDPSLEHQPFEFNSSSSSSFPSSGATSPASETPLFSFDDQELGNLDQEFDMSNFPGDVNAMLHEGLLGNEDGILNNLNTNIMWPASNDNANNSFRSRVGSLTLSECDSVLGSGALYPADDVDIGQLIDEDDDEDDEQEIDVVSDSHSVSSSASTVSATSIGDYAAAGSSQSNSSCSFSSASSASFNAPVQAGRSLLKKNLFKKQQPTAPPPQQQSNKQLQPENSTPQPLIDHAYFAIQGEMSPVPSPGPSSPIPGMLTPNESSEDEDWQNQGCSSSKTMVASKKSRQNATSSATASSSASLTTTSSEPKFRFLMKYNTPKSLLRSASSSTTSNNGRKRKSAILNPHCPDPSPKKARMSNVAATNSTGNNNPAKFKASSAATAAAKSAGQKPKASSGTGNKRGRKPAAAGSMESAAAAPRKSKYAGNSDEKCRELRDMHNSMERARRVDLARHFIHLKTLVPELEGMDKASKLNTLNRSAEYCKHLHKTDRKNIEELRRETEILANNKRKLKMLMQELDVNVSTAAAYSGSHRSTSSRHH